MLNKKCKYLKSLEVAELTAKNRRIKWIKENIAAAYKHSC